jgi:hypothetical protein
MEIFRHKSESLWLVSTHQKKGMNMNGKDQNDLDHDHVHMKEGDGPPMIKIVMNV